jgi:hypothetical protein
MNKVQMLKEEKLRLRKMLKKADGVVKRAVMNQDKSSEKNHEQTSEETKEESKEQPAIAPVSNDIAIEKSKPVVKPTEPAPKAPEVAPENTESQNE